MAEVFIVSFRWLDIPDSQDTSMMFPTRGEAAEYVNKLVNDQNGMKEVDPKSSGQLEITVSRYMLAAVVSVVTA